MDIFETRVEEVGSAMKEWRDKTNVSLTEDGKGYTVTGDERVPEGIILPRVTGVLSVIEKYGLRTWAMRMALTHVEENLAEAAQVMPFDEALKLTLEGAAKAHEERRDTAADYGTEAHARLQQKFIEPDTVVPKEFKPVVDSWEKWMEEAELKVLATEMPLYYHDTVSRMAPVSFAGTADLIALDKNGMPVICDYKTGASIYSEYALQMGAYAMSLAFCGIGNFLSVDQMRNTRAVVVRLPKEEGLPIEVREVEDVLYHQEVFEYTCKLRQWQSKRNKWIAKKKKRSTSKNG